MSNLRFRIAATGAVMALALGTAAALAPVSSWAATPSCGKTCPDIFSHQFGTHRSPAYALDVLRQGEKVGQPIILFRVADYDPALDWSASFQGTVADFYAEGLVSAAVDLHYGGQCEEEAVVTPSPTPTPTVTVTVTATPTITTSALIVTAPSPVAQECVKYYPDDPAFEIQYSPYGVDSGLCMGLASAAASGGKVTLQPCGDSARTVWIADTYDSPSTLFNGYVPLINGSDGNFSQPFVLTYPGNGYPTDIPRPQLTVTNLSGESQGTPPGPVLGTVNDNQLWGADIGVLN